MYPCFVSAPCFVCGDTSESCDESLDELSATLVSAPASAALVSGLVDVALWPLKGVRGAGSVGCARGTLRRRAASASVGVGTTGEYRWSTGSDVAVVCNVALSTTRGVSSRLLRLSLACPEFVDGAFVWPYFAACGSTLTNGGGSVGCTGSCSRCSCGGNGWTTWGWVSCWDRSAGGGGSGVCCW